jgi:Transposase DDE domain
VGPREVLIGDRGYAHAKGLGSVQQAGGEFLVRLNWQNLPLQTLQGEAFDLLQAARGIADTKAAEFAVQTAATRKTASIPARLVILRKSELASQESRKKILQEARKKGRQVDPRTLEAASYIFLLTSLPADHLNASQVLELYRFRWQVELAFKRMKSLWAFGSVPAKDPDLARAYIYAKLLTALLVEDLTETLRSHSPWGFRLPVPA